MLNVCAFYIWGLFFLGFTLATAMVNAGLTTFSKIEQTSPRELEIVSQNILQNFFRSLEKHLFMMKSFCCYSTITDFFFCQIVNRHPPFGNQIKEAVSKLPKCEVTLEQVTHYIFVFFYVGQPAILHTKIILLPIANSF